MAELIHDAGDNHIDVTSREAEGSGGLGNRRRCFIVGTLAVLVFASSVLFLFKPRALAHWSAITTDACDPPLRAHPASFKKKGGRPWREEWPRPLYPADPLLKDGFAAFWAWYKALPCAQHSPECAEVPGWPSCCKTHLQVKGKMIALSDHLRRVGWPHWWVHSGSMLGLVREEGRLVPHDQDADIHIVAKFNGHRVFQNYAQRMARRDSLQSTCLDWTPCFIFIFFTQLRPGFSFSRIALQFHFRWHSTRAMRTRHFIFWPARTHPGRGSQPAVGPGVVLGADGRGGRPNAGRLSTLGRKTNSWHEKATSSSVVVLSTEVSVTWTYTCFASKVLDTPTLARKLFLAPTRTRRT